ncbi:MAG TPA: YceI family protein [Gemmatimonadaceae bacterium]|nr:YceI family protein [Gemmatimonadaceae bacterium]
MITRTVLTAAAIALLGTTLSAQTSAVRLQLAPGSQLTFDGTSTLHGFTCTTSTMQAYIDVDPSYQTASLNTIAHPIVNVQVVIPVRSLKCGGELDNNMYKTLNATQFPYVIYKLTSYDLVTETATASKFSATTHGALTIAGKDNPIQMTIDAARGSDGVVSATSEQAIKMSAFGIKPPTFMLGTLRVGDQLKVKFTLKATQAAVASAMSELSSELALTTPAVTQLRAEPRK